ncbi:MAG: PorP/SprF family type IX secretion system membrane protein [Clostridiales bacterium]|nr:PorP/SprF family type IX secretion system membrane protein [Clostridiales bacterium]
MRQILHSHIFTLLLITASVMLGRGIMRAQSDAQFTQYYEIPAYYNAGAIGTSDLLRIRGGMRMQWVGIDNAPRNFVATADMPVRVLGKRIAVGLVMNQGSMGLYRSMNLSARLAYHQPLFKGRLSIGLGAGFVDQSFKGSEVFLPDDDDYHQGSDDAIPTNDIRGNALDLSAGLFYTHKYFWVGVSGNHLNNPTVTLNADSGDNSNGNNYEFTIGRTLYFMAGSNITIKNTLLEVIPSVLVKSDLTFTTGEITARVRYNKFLSAGIGYRYKDAVSLILAAELKGFYVGYSYDYATSAIAKASSGSHELIAGYSLKLDFSEKNKNKHKSIRIM